MGVTLEKGSKHVLEIRTKDKETMVTKEMAETCLPECAQVRARIYQRILLSFVVRET